MVCRLISQISLNVGTGQETVVSWGSLGAPTFGVSKGSSELSGHVFSEECSLSFLIMVTLLWKVLLH